MKLDYQSAGELDGWTAGVAVWQIQGALAVVGGPKDGARQGSLATVALLAAHPPSVDPLLVGSLRHPMNKPPGTLR